MVRLITLVRTHACQLRPWTISEHFIKFISNIYHAYIHYPRALSCALVKGHRSQKPGSNSLLALQITNYNESSQICKELIIKRVKSSI